MTTAKREITAGDILPAAEYAAIRREHRRHVAAIKRLRRIAVGPFTTWHFESYETMWHQVHEMLFIEKGGAEQVPDEIAAYNPLIPKGSELVATIMIEIDDPIRRARSLARLGGIERMAFLRVAGETVTGVPEDDQDRTNEQGKASAVQFIHFPFTPAQIAKFAAPGTEVMAGFGHPEYGHIAVMPEAIRAALSQDFAA
ncbi:uncharacterized protein DUF3501 [Stella humosa]|uniref:Uncharacterized protein DUF3501 n=1 Tax=Stella humosa TaxID=94 RepID=A0A3N1L1K2_9PROT|nr:DUF3501 family protein [Stella humosa]ROP84336.1 uncharacterized protein DUF3501 [Stella humosa]BBK33850.1 hypothetical protein STHU_44840 [Stella humosa]